VVVHGGGSFGHTVAIQHGIGSEPGETTASAVAQTRGAMYDLNRLVCKTMMEFKLNPYPFSPFDAIVRGGKASLAQWLRSLLKANLTPVTFGDVVVASRGFRVLSGDLIVEELAKILKPERCVFALDVDGVYEQNTRVIIPELTPSRIRKLSLSAGGDATGGMKLKLEVAAKVASRGPKVAFVSGYRRNEFSKAIRGLDFYGTTVRS
jgi:isopentenyl phosphate kinase